MYLVTVRNATGAPLSLILENIVMYASQEMLSILLAKWNKSRGDFCAQASELALWAQEIDDSSLSLRPICNTVNAADDISNRV